MLKSIVHLVGIHSDLYSLSSIIIGDESFYMAKSLVLKSLL